MKTTIAIVVTFILVILIITFLCLVYFGTIETEPIVIVKDYTEQIEYLETQVKEIRKQVIFNTGIIDGFRRNSAQVKILLEWVE